MTKTGRFLLIQKWLPTYYQLEKISACYHNICQKINFEDIFAIEKVKNRQTFIPKRSFYLTQNETTAQFANDSDNKTSIVAAAGASIDDENVYVIENTYEKHTFFGSLLNKIYGPTESTLKVIKRTDVDNKQKGKGKDAKNRTC